MSFHEIVFPSASLSYGPTGGPVFSTSVAVTSSGFEQRNQNWTAVRHEYDVSTALETPADFDIVRRFFLGRRGRLFGFRFRDPVDFNSGSGLDHVVTPFDQGIGFGAGPHQLVKAYADAIGAYIRIIRKPVAGTLRVAVQGTETLAGGAFPWSLDSTTGVLTFTGSGPSLPTIGQQITGGFEFHVPVRFDTDSLPATYETFRAVAARGINLVEVRV